MEGVFKEIIRKERRRLDEESRKEHPELFDPDVIEAMNELNREFPGVKPDESYLPQAPMDRPLPL
jgi:hypothetical protein